MSENPAEQVAADENVQPVQAVPAEPNIETDEATPVDEAPVEPEHGNYDVRYQSATESDADYNVEETNPKEDVTDE